MKQEIEEDKLTRNKLNEERHRIKSLTYGNTE